MGTAGGETDRDAKPSPSHQDFVFVLLSAIRRYLEAGEGAGASYYGVEFALSSHAKVRTYLRNGTSEVWQVYPDSRTVTIYKGEFGHTLSKGQQLTSDALPGFTALIASFFD